MPLGLLCACSRGPTPRLPTPSEMSPETVVVNYAPERLRVFVDRGSEGGPGDPRYLVLGSERPGLPATWRPLAVVDRRPPAGYLVRAGDLAWVAGRVVAGEAAGGKAALLVYDRDGRRAERVPLKLPGPCTADAPPLLQGDGDRLHGALRCPSEERSYVFTFAGRGDGAGALVRAAAVPVLAELFQHAPEGDYLLGGRRLVRAAPDGTVAVADVGAPGAPEARELLLGNQEVLVVDGAAGQVLRLDRQRLQRRGRVRFPRGPAVRLRAALAGDHVLVVVAERRRGGTELLGHRVPLDGRGRAAPLLLGTGPAVSDHEVVPVAEAGVRALLVRTHEGNTGPLVALAKLGF